MSSVGQRRSAQQFQPKTFKLSVKAILQLPYRLCHPPSPSVGKVRSCGVTPVYKVQLEDILSRKHLPPLGLKDFEEWLLYVEHCPENLYFTLWLKEYTAMYSQWALKSKPRRNAPGEYHLTVPSPGSSTLGMFYVRAKQTFFTPNSDFELNVPSDILSPFHTSNFGSPHPDPALFQEVASEVEKMLKESLDRFVLAAYNNVGNSRGLCGILGGTFLALCGSLPVMVYNILRGYSRWLRLAAFPSLWVGLTVVLASIHGVCMMVYVFGDLRQLRKFEMARPAISRPQPLPGTRRPVVSSPTTIQVPAPITRPPILPATQSLSIQSPSPVPIHPHDSVSRTSSVHSSSYEASVSSLGTRSSPSEGGFQIEISPAYWDEDPCPEGPATTPTSPTYAFSTKDTEPPQSNQFTNTASFIHPFYSSSDDEVMGGGMTTANRQPISPFDFDALPHRSRSTPLPPHSPKETLIDPSEEREQPRSNFLLSPKALILYAQYKCGNKFFVSTTSHLNDPEKGSPPQEPSSAHVNSDGKKRPSGAKVQAQFKLVKAVPAFASPLTKILSPVVSRAQWEIVVRSAVLAFLLSWAIVGCLLAVPVRRP